MVKEIKPALIEVLLLKGFCVGPEKPGKSWNFILTLFRTIQSWKKTSGLGKSWKSAYLKQYNFQNFHDKKCWTDFEILGMKRLMWNLGSWKKSIWAIEKSLKSSWNLSLKKERNPVVISLSGRSTKGEWRRKTTV